MNPLIESLNLWGERFLSFAWPLLWQSSLLIVVVLGLDFALRRRVRAAVRYALWLVVLLKLVLPPSLALPTGLGWWLQPRHAPPAKPQPTFVVTYGNPTATELPPVVEAAYTPPPLRLSRDGSALAAWASVSVVLLGWMGVRWRQIARDIRRATPAPPGVDELLTAAREQAGLRRRVELRLTARPMSPAVCGLIRPVILLPRSLVEQLPPAQLRSVLLHELIHLRRGDVWVNCAQALLQVAYWWHPLLWLANAGIRRAREEAVDDAVMLALCDDAESYAPTLLEVAKLAFHRPLASLGLVGILESRNALRQRIERLVTFRPPRKAGLTIVSALCVLFLAAVALPMGEPPASSVKESPTLMPSGTSLGTAKLNTNDNPAAGETLVTRVLKFDPEVFLPNLRQRMNLPDRSTDTEVIQVLPSLLAEMGLDLQPPCTSFYKERGLAIFRAPRAKIEAIERLFTELNNGRPQSEIPRPGRPPDQETIICKLDQIRIDSPAYNETPLIEVVRDLTWETKHRDPERNGFAFRIKYSSSQGKMVDLSSVKVTVPASSNVRLSDLLEAIVKGADKPINYHIWAGVAFYAKGEEPALPLGRSVGDGLAKSEGAGAILSRGPETNLVSRNPLRDGDDHRLVPQTHAALAGRTFKLEPDALFSRLEQRGYLSEAEVRDARTAQKSWGPPEPMNVGGSLYILRRRTNSPGPIQGALSAFFSDAGLDLRPPKILYFDDVNGELTVRATISDLDFIQTLAEDFNPRQPEVLVRPKSVEVPGKTPTNKLDQRSHRPDRQNFPTPTSQANAALFTRVFKIDPNTLFRNLEEHGYLSQAQVSELTAAQKSWGTPQREEDSRLTTRTNSSDPAFLAIRAFLSNAGLDLRPPESLFFNARDGQLIVRATQFHMELIQDLVASLSYTPPQITLGSKFIEMPERDYVELWGKWTPLSHSASDGWAVVLTSAQARKLVNGLQANPNVDIVTGPSVTTLSGRQAQIQIVDFKTIVTGLTSMVTNNVTNFAYQTQHLAFGPVLDVLPIVSADGHTIRMTCIPTVTEFIGYDDPRTFVPNYAPGTSNHVVLPLPHFRVRQTTTSIAVRDGQTVVIGNVLPVEIITKPDGKEDHILSTDKNLKRLIVLVTPTIIDAAGNRVHSEEEMPFARERVPPQPLR